MISMNLRSPGIIDDKIQFAKKTFWMCWWRVCYSTEIWKTMYSLTFLSCRQKSWEFTGETSSVGKINDSGKWQRFSTAPEETDNISADYFSVCNLLVRMHDEVPGARRLHKARLMTVNINSGQNSARFPRVLRLAGYALSINHVQGWRRWRSIPLLYNWNATS